MNKPVLTNALTNAQHEMREKYGAPAIKGTFPKSGKNYEIFEGFASNATQAQKFADGDSSKYLPSLMSQLVLIDGDYIVPEQITGMRSKDYHELMKHFNEVNF